MNRTPRWLCWLAAIAALFALAVQVQGGTLTLREVKGSAITNAEYDANFAEKYEAVAHGFSVGNLVYKSGASTWAKAISTASSTYADGVVVAVPSANVAYIATKFGQPYTKTAHGFGSAGTAVYLSDSVAGNATASVTDQQIGQVLDANTIIFGVMGAGGGGETGSYSGTADPLKTFDSTGGTGYKDILTLERAGVPTVSFSSSADDAFPFSPTFVMFADDGTTTLLDMGCDRTTNTCWLGQDVTGEVLNLYGPDGATIDLGSLVTVAPRLELNGTCLDDDSDRLFGDKDCDGTKDAGEEYLDLTGGGSGNSFETIDAPAGTDPVADSSTDTLALTAADGLAITGNSGTDTLAFSLTLAGDVDGSGSANDIDETAVESELEGVMDLQDMQGAVTDGQVPNTLTLDLPGSTLTSMDDDKVLVGTGVGTSSYVTISNCDDTTEKLDWNGTAFNCQTDASGGGSGDNITVNATAATDAKFLDGDIDWTIATGPTPDEITATVACSGCIDVTDIGADAVGASEIATGGVDLASGDVTGTLPVANGGTGVTSRNWAQVLDAVGAAEIINDNTEQTTYSFSIPAGALGTTRSVHLSFRGDYLNSSGSNKTYTIKIKYGATTMYEDVNTTASATNRHPLIFDVWLGNTGETNSQYMTFNWISGNAVAATTGLGDLATATTNSGQIGSGTATEDSTAAKTFTVTMTLSSALSTVAWKRQFATLTLY